MLLFKGSEYLKNENLLITSNLVPKDNKRIPLNNKKVVCKNRATNIGLDEFSAILRYVIKARYKYNFSYFPLVIELGECIFDDKLTYILLEILFHYYIKNENAKVTLNFACSHNIVNEGIKTSILKLINERTPSSTISKKYLLDISQSHYRKIIKKDDSDPANVSRIVQDVDDFLKYYNVTDEYRDGVSEVIGELIDNALDHASSDCLLDLDITQNYVKTSDLDGSKYYGVNIVIVNFSDILLGEKICEKIKQTELSDRFKELKKAYQFHSDFFNESYNERDFFTIASFQHKISSRNLSTGGTGLTRLIKNLEEKSDAYSCYVISGDKQVNFIKELLSYDENEWIGFNKCKDFLSNIPDRNVITKAPFFFPGTAYNLNFVLKRED